MSEQRISTAPVKELAIAAGIENPYQLHKVAGISYNTAKRYWYDDPTRKQIPDEILLKLVGAIGCEPGELIVIQIVDQ